jgi:aminoglycoside phosphotransferase (APT) family kinase protein
MSDLGDPGRLDGASRAAAPGRLIGAGRAADVYDLGGGRVLRRYRVSPDLAPEARERLESLVQLEARLMTHLLASGFPVPEVFEASGGDLVMTRVDGVDMLADIGKHPWLAWRHARTLARMHDLLHEIEAPSFLPRPFGDGDRVMHLDLHPGNVMLTSTGPVVIDWSNCAAGPPGADVAMASLIMRTSEVGDLPAGVRLVAGLVRNSLVRRFERSVTCDFEAYLVPVARHRLVDRNTRPSEAAHLQQIIDGGA